MDPKNLETKGVPKKSVWHGDETKISMADTPGKVYADEGAREHLYEPRQEKDNITGFLVQNAVGEKLMLYPILCGDTTANLPGMHTPVVSTTLTLSINSPFICQTFQDIINKKTAMRGEWKSLQFWVNDTCFMDRQSFHHWQDGLEIPW